MRLAPADEKARYDTHRNGDEGHRRFLEPVARAVAENLPAGARGLDWGSGPVPALAEMLGERSFDMRIYDPFYHDVRPQGAFDFITTTEVIEHCHEPARDLCAMRELLAPGGWLFVMTETHPGPAKMASWYYWRDPTHVSFFSPRSFEKFATLFGLELVRGSGRLWAFRQDDRAEKISSRPPVSGSVPE
ncbi:MAG: class I SAM-dependent methyltransferase [Bdellovibrionaceae bacterium]|nr:class I SAM-dependent methyltransferase [Pseudobdellovibrionaceae bacterium]